MVSSGSTFILKFFGAISIMKFVIGQNSESFRIPNNGDTCNVINLNIGRGEEAGPHARGPQGPPGKRGSIGIRGIQGSKGQKGETGPRGITPEVDIIEVTSAVLKALAATSCKELMDIHGISSTGYYQMRSNDTDLATYKYCNFQTRNVETCEELRQTIGDDMKKGYYFVAMRNDFIYCHVLPRDCGKVVRTEAKISLPSGGVFDLRSDSFGAVEVVCDLQTDGGGWTVFQKRMDGSVDFFRNWSDYVNGFGDKDGEFWLGLESIYQLTKNRNYELRVDLADWYGNTAYAKYGSFSISSRDDNYRLTLGEYSGDAGNSLSSRHNNQQFSTKDADNDVHSRISCAQSHKGGWWYGKCIYSNLNGLYNKTPGTGTTGIVWYDWKNRWEYLKSTEMKFRRKR